MGYEPRVPDYDIEEGLPTRQPEVTIFQGAHEETPYLLVRAASPGIKREFVAPVVRNHAGTLDAPWDWRAAELAGLPIED